MANPVSPPMTPPAIAPAFVRDETDAGDGVTATEVFAVEKVEDVAEVAVEDNMLDVEYGVGIGPAGNTTCQKLRAPFK